MLLVKFQSSASTYSRFIAHQTAKMAIELKNHQSNGPALDDVALLTQAMVRIDSSSPDMGSVHGPGETKLAKFIAKWLQDHAIETHWIETTPGRPSVVGIVRGSGGGKSLMLNGHTDTVTLLGYDGDALSGEIVDDKLYGRGSADMKSGLAASMIALLKAKTMDLLGDVILTAVSDEEYGSIGTEDVIAAGWRADAAIVAEPTVMDIIVAHKGFVIFEVDIFGVASHGSRPDLGVDAICKAGHFLVELECLGKKLQSGPLPTGSPEADLPSVHAGIIAGGEEVSSYPARCTISIDRRITAAETPESAREELIGILDSLTATVPGFHYEVRTIISRPPHAIALDHPFIEMVVKHATTAMGRQPVIRGERYWTDMALLAAAGIPGVIWGARGFGLHSKTEWVELESVRHLLDTFVAIAGDLCRQPKT
jgi:acetylornithine deacetylase/succinyl-diaminopimelate desuccinylase-like protein